MFKFVILPEKKNEKQLISKKCRRFTRLFLIKKYVVLKTHHKINDLTDFFGQNCLSWDFDSGEWRLIKTDLLQRSSLVEAFRK